MASDPRVPDLRDIDVARDPAIRIYGCDVTPRLFFAKIDLSRDTAAVRTHSKIRTWNKQNTSVD